MPFRLVAIIMTTGQARGIFKMSHFRSGTEIDTSYNAVITSGILKVVLLILVSGCPADAGRIGKRVQIPRGRATVMDHDWVQSQETCR